MVESYRKDCADLMQAAAAPSRDARVISGVLDRLRAYNLFGAFSAYVRRLGSPELLPIPLLLKIASNASALNDQGMALAYLDEAYRADPNFPPTLLSRAQVLVYHGRFSQAERDLLACTKRAPEIEQAWWLLSRLRRQVSEANHIGQLRRMLAIPGRSALGTALLGYALHKELDDIGDHTGATEALALACRSKRSTLTYQADDSQQLFEALERTGMEGNERPAAMDGRTPIFIIGMHRSGTTLLEQLLDGHANVKGVGELYDFTNQMRLATDHYCRSVIDTTIVVRSQGVDWRGISEGYMEGVGARLRDETHFTDKLPSNFLNAGFICRALPQAKLLHMVREPNEVAFSNLRELFSDANPYSYDQLELANFYQGYLRLMKHWHQRFPGRILDVDYARLTKDPESVIKEVCAFCGLDFQPGMLRLQERTGGVATASAVQVRNTVVALEQPKWLPYRDYLQPFIQAMA